MNKRSQFEKYMNDPKLSKGSAGAHFQNQMYHSKSVKGGKSYAGAKEFKTSQTLFGSKTTTEVIGLTIGVILRPAAR